MTSLMNVTDLDLHEAQQLVAQRLKAVSPADVHVTVAVVPAGRLARDDSGGTQQRRMWDASRQTTVPAHTEAIAAAITAPRN
jgi:hypothetical protein